ncbi:glycosyltransferase involved in cell wall biosynthesis [Ruminiclostridium sufflavum DSM 19573]|uniref:Glycosyltransferase involved in cell wall biosynthesis n=1 Tax=Ruminiclostridium sufflavum DSM 19573 TaxID=1121337 RepID=A0A318XP11_9FIRM|nr:bifunctional glycosyltransferase family 2/GtrA family protein [Ruminiclostridium sufflavum]PYG88783.1 glycosyltransferase involved in cell wall biosynthesis [Ruminiclostridium sufflavum DSM 19573]
MKIIIPAYEPDKKLIELIRAIRENSDYGIIVVNDGSAEKYKAIFTQAGFEGCIVLSHKINLGKGAALKTAFTYLLQKGIEKEGIVCADCDGQHTWQDIIKIAESIVWHKNSVILGCREFTGSIPLKSLIGNKITGFIFSLASGCKITDTQTGLRGFSANMLSWLIQIKGNRYEYEMNQLLEAKSSGYELFCIPIKTIYENNNKSSHFHPVRDSVKIYLPILSFCFSSAACGIIDFICLFIFNRITKNLLISVIAARAVSSLVNYILNKNLVFNAKKQLHRKALIKYYCLVAAILICNYLMLDFFTDTMSLSLFISKILTEAILFFVSYFTQKKYIFT